ncbi:MAG: transporter [Gammaproteobacteria bacterium]|jgi:hypothetical protein
MRNRCIKLAGFWIALVMSGSAPVAAAEQQTQSFEYQLRQRDQVILELLERVKALEQQVEVVPSRHEKPKQPAPAQVEKEKDNVTTSPGLVVADESMAERALERSLTRAGAVLLAPGRLELEPRLLYVRQEDSTPSFLSTGSGVIASQTEINSDSITASMILRYGLPGDAQLAIAVPYHWRRTQTLTRVNFSPVSSTTQSGTGQGDVQLTLAKTLSGGVGEVSNVIGSLSWNTGNGTLSSNGVSLGAGYQALQAGLSLTRRQDPLVLVSAMSYQHSFEENAIQPGPLVSASVAGYLALNPRTSMSLSLVMTYQQETRVNGSPQAGSTRTIGTLLLGGSTLVGRGTLFNLSLGIGLTRDANDLSVMASLPIRF